MTATWKDDEGKDVVSSAESAPLLLYLNFVSQSYVPGLQMVLENLAESGFLGKLEEIGLEIRAAGGVIPALAKLMVQELEDDTAEEVTALLQKLKEKVRSNLNLLKMRIFKINLELAGRMIQPNGTVYLKLPVPGGLKGRNLEVYRVEEGTFNLVRIGGVDASGDFLEVDTDHFSYFVLVEREDEEENAQVESAQEQSVQGTQEDPTDGETQAMSAVRQGGPIKTSDSTNWNLYKVLVFTLVLGGAWCLVAFLARRRRRYPPKH